MTKNNFGNFEACFGELEDPRLTNKCAHNLIDILIIAVCGVLCGADTWVDIEEFGCTKKAWLGKFLDLPNGIPAHDTFGRVFSLIDGESFQRCFMRWVEQVYQVSAGQVVAIDGKKVRGSYDTATDQNPIHLVSAWASANGIVLGQVKVDDKSNEITAIPQLLRLLDLRGCLVTIDAMGCQTKIAQIIREEQADYLLRVKGNQGNLQQDIEDWFSYGDQTNFAAMQVDYAQTLNKDHGRLEIRRCWAIDDPLVFDYIRHFEGWTDLTSILRIERERHWPDGHREKATAYYISSLPACAQTLMQAARDHWTIENNLHWILDVSFREDASRIRQGNSPQNMAVVRHLALNLLKRDTSKGSLRRKRFRAALDEDFLQHLIAQI